MRVERLSIPDAVKGVLAKAGYDELYPPQEDAIKAGALDGKNIVLASPTASGKTLIAELVILKSILEKGGKALYLTPLRALASEKYEDFQKYTSIEKAPGRRIRVAVTSGDYDSSDIYLASYDIVISTNEKADSLLRHRSPWISDISVVIADEIHLLTEAERGPTLEVILTRLLKLNPKVQIIALSATIKNAAEIGEWLRANQITTEWRPVPLREGVYYNGEIQFKDGSSRAIPRTDANPVFNTAIDVVRGGGQVLIFAETRRMAVEMGRKASALLRRHLPKPDRRGLENIAQRILSAGERTRLGEALAEQVLNGVAFHHAGLAGPHRKIIEEGFKAGRLKILSATPTLCLHPDTLITTNRGPVRIADLRSGEMVLTHTGAFKKVLTTSVRQFCGELLEVNGAGMIPVLMTPEHRVLRNTVRRPGRSSFHYPVRSEPEWVRACDLQVSDEVQTPIEGSNTDTDGGSIVVQIQSKALRRAIRTYNTPIQVGRTLHSPVRSIKRLSYSGPVYNLHIEDDESYVCSFAFSVHNSAGVNLPARTVVISSYERYEPGYGRYPISVLEYKQFCGRAGRPKYDKYGEAILIAKTEDEQDYLMKNYALAEPERIWSKLGAERVLRPHVLATIATRFANSEDGLVRFFAKTFYAFQYDPKMIKSKLGDILSFLNREQMVEFAGQDLKATKFGRRVSELYIDPVSAVVLRDGLYTRAKNITEVSFLHLISRTPDIAPKLYPRRGEDEMLDLFAREHQDEFMCEVPEYYGDTNGITYEEFLSEIKCARVLYEWINETSEDGILEVHKVEPGDILRMVDTAKWLLHATYQLAELFGHKDLLKPTYELQIRCAKGVKRELVPLVELEGVGRVRARSLYSAGYQSIEELKHVSVTDLMNVPLIGPTLAKRIKEQVGGLIKADEWESLKSKSAEGTEQSLLTDYKEAEDY